MNIGYVCGAFPVITETFILNEIVDLIRRGHKVYVFSILPPKVNFIHREVSEFNLFKNNYYLPNPKKKLNQIRLIWKSIGLFGWEYPCESFKIKVLSIATAKYFSEVAKQLSIDILHAHFNDTSTHSAMLMSKKLEIPFTFTAHAVDIFVNPSVKALKERMDKSSAIITISDYNRDYLHQLTNIDKNKIHVVRACPSIEKFKSLKRNPEPFRILTIGRLIEKKGIKYGIMSIGELVKDYPKIQYLIVGSGQLQNELKLLVSQLSLQNNVKFLGNLDDGSLSDEFSKATIFILPCIRAENGDMDGIPVSLMEAMYLQIPVISTKVSGIPELIENNQEGFLVEPKDSKQLTHAIRTLLEDKSLREELGKYGRKKIIDKFNINKEVEKMIKIWAEI